MKLYDSRWSYISIQLVRLERSERRLFAIKKAKIEKKKLKSIFREYKEFLYGPRTVDKYEKTY